MIGWLSVIVMVLLIIEVFNEKKITERIKMEIDDILKNLRIDKGNPNSVYLREIVRLMEQIEILELEVDQLKKELKNGEKEK